MIRRLRLKFVCINMAIVTAMLLGIFGMVVRFTMNNLEDQSERMLHTVMEGGSKMVGRPGNPEGGVQLPFFYVRIDTFGKMTTAIGGYLDLSDEDILEEIVCAAVDGEESMGLLRQYNLRYYKRANPFGLSIAFVDVSSELATVRSLVKTCISISILSFSAFLGLSFLLARWAVRPVERAWNQQRQFVADASHELKTPLTVIMTNAELLQAVAGEQTEIFAGNILTMSHQMRGLVDSLLELARVDNGAAGVEFSRLNLSELVAEAVLPFEPVYFERELMLESRIEPELWVRGSYTHLKQVADILLDNGAKYSAPNGTVFLELRRIGNSVLLTMAGPGEAISRENLKNIFKRFYRIDKARSMTGSFGLGLSIADSIVRTHGGRIWAESKEGINTFFVQLPAL